MSRAATVDTQKTTAIGFMPYCGATQSGKLNVEALEALSEDAPLLLLSQTPVDARNQVLNVTHDIFPRWSVETSIHAEMYIVRYWLQIEYAKNNDLDASIKALRNRKILATQPACHCCAALMTEWGILFNKDKSGNKPNTGWMHPLGNYVLSNDAMKGMDSKEIASDERVITDDPQKVAKFS